MPIVMKLSIPEDNWSGWELDCSNVLYHNLSYELGLNDDDCPKCEKNATHNHLKYLLKQLKKENPKLKENPVRFDVGPKDSKSPFKGYIIWFF